MKKVNKNTKLGDINKKSHISGVSDGSLIKYTGKVCKILRVYSPWKIGTKYYTLEDIETGEKFYDVQSCDCLSMNLNVKK